MKKALISVGLVLMLVETRAGYGLVQGDSELSAASAADGPTGSWLVKGETALQGQFNVLMTFHSDGTVIADEPSAHETAGHGSWTRQGHNQYAYTFLAFIGSPTGAYSGWIKVVGTLDLDRNSWDGPFRVDVFDPAGVTLLTDNGTFSGRAILVPKHN